VAAILTHNKAKFEAVLLTASFGPALSGKPSLIAVNTVAIRTTLLRRHRLVRKDDRENEA
jgi:hypothetical protein